MPKRPRHPALIVATVVAIFLFSQILAGLLVSIAGLGFGVRSSGINDWLETSAPAQFGFIAIAEGLVMLSVWLLCGRSLSGLKALGMGRPDRGTLKRVLAGILAVYGLLFIGNILIQLLLPQIQTDQQQDIGFSGVTSHGDVALTFVSLVLLPPIAEETLVRGYMFTKLRMRLDFRRTLLITSVLFGLAHLQFGSGQPLLWAAAFDIFLLSLVLGYLREKTGTIWAGVGVHALNNLVAFLLRFHGVIF